jgi:hypothetical protein
MDFSNETESQISEEMKNLIKSMVNVKQANEPDLNFAEIMNPQNISEIDPS